MVFNALLQVLPRRLAIVGSALVYTVLVLLVLYASVEPPQPFRYTNM